MSTPKRIVIIGAGGFAREVEWLLREINQANGVPLYEFKGFLVSDINKLGIYDSADLVLGDFSWLEAYPDAVDAVVIGIGNPEARLRIGLEIQTRFPFLDMPTLIHSSVRIDRKSLDLGVGVILCSGVVGTVNIRIGNYAAVHVGCTLGHEAVIGRGANINPGSNISGGVELGDGVLVGTGVQILQYLSIGHGATVGAGAVVTKHVPPGMTVVGVPAKQIPSTISVAAECSPEVIGGKR